MTILILALVAINLCISFFNHFKLKKIMSAQDQINATIQELNDATTSISNRIQSIIAAEGNNVSSDSLTELQAVADQLKALGADPANPIPSTGDTTGTTSGTTTPSDSSTPSDGSGASQPVTDTASNQAS